MNTKISEDLQVHLKRYEEFATEKIWPLEESFLTQHFDEVLPKLENLREEAKAAGLWAPHLPSEWGGIGLTLSEFAHVSQVLGMSPLGHYCFNCQAPDVGNMEILMQYGTDEQKQRYLQPLTEGQIRSCFAMTEPDLPGSNPTWMATTAIHDGTDYVINGRKWFTSSADGAEFAICMAVTNPDTESLHQRASMIIVPTDNPGYERVRNIPVMGHAGSGYYSHAEVVFNNCHVPKANLLGPEGAGFVIAQERLGPGRIHHCMRWLGICERAFDLMCRRANSREITPGRSLGSKQITQAWIAESRAEINAAKLMVLDAADVIDSEGTYAAREEISLIKFYVADVLQKVLDRAIQTHGALGMTDYTPLAFWYREERAARIYDGADEVHKVSVAKRILKRYGESGN